MSLEEAFRWYMPGEPPPLGEVWHWTGAVDHYGYGTLGHGGKLYKAHRLSYEIFNGPIPKGLVVRHLLDIPVDVNPNNLILGTHADNGRDRKIRGVNPNARREALQRPEPPLATPKLIAWQLPKGPADFRGEKNGRTKLTAEQVLEIRARYAAGGTSYQKLADEFGVSNVMIANIVKRVNWTHI